MDEAKPAPRREGRHPAESGIRRSRLTAAPLADVLGATIEQARASYRDGRREEAITQAIQVEEDASRGGSEELAAISGAAAALIGLCQQYDGLDDLARQAFARAIAAFRRVPAMVAERGDYTADLGVALAAFCETDGNGQAAEAESSLRQAIELGENTPDVRRGLAVASRALGHFDDAVSLLTKSLRRAPRDWQAAAELARTLEASGAPHDEAISAWAQAALVTHEFGPAVQAAPMFDLAEARQATDPDMLTAAGRAWAQTGRYDDAIQALERAVLLRDDHIDAWLALAQAHWLADHDDQALTTYRETLKRDPDTLPALLGFAEVALLYLRQPDLVEEAERYARRATVLAPADAGGYVALGEALRLLGQYDEAVMQLSAGMARLAPDQALMAFALGTRGQVRLARGELAEAIADLTEAADQAPGLTWVHRDLGTAHMMTYYAGGAGRPEHLAAALDHLGRAVELNPSDVEAALQLSEIQLDSGDNAGAERTLLAVLEMAPDPKEVHLALGTVRFSGGRYKEALESVDQAMPTGEQATAPGADAQPWVLRGRILRELDRAPEALASLEQAVRLAPDDPGALGWLGEIERSLGRFPEAIAHLSEALGMKPGDGWTLASRGAAYLQHDDAAHAAADLCAALDAGETTAFLISYLERAASYSDVTASILTAWERALERAPDEVALRAELGITYVNLIAAAGSGWPNMASYAESARQHLARAAEAGSDPIVLLALGTARFLLGDATEAREAVRAALALKPTVDNLADVAGVLQQMGFHAEALEIAEQALAERPDFTRTMIVKGQALYGLERLPEADLALSAVPEADRDAGVWTTLGEIHRISGNFAQAVEELTRADHMAPDNAWTLGSLGAAQLAAGQKEDGLASLRRAIEISPAYLFALSQLRIALADPGRSAEAINALAAAAEYAPDDADIKIEYAIALGVAGRHREALDVIDDMLLRAPDNTTGLRVAGWLLTMLGRQSDAVASYSRAVEVTPYDFDALADLADALVTDKQPVEAMAMLERAAAIMETADVAALRSQIFAAIALWPAAIEAGERAVELDAKNIAGHNSLGWAIAHHMPLDAQRMHDVFRTALTLDSQNPGVRKELANALLLLGRTDEARDELLRAIELALEKPSSDFDTHWTRGVCLFQLRRHREAAEAYSQAESGLGSPVGLLMDIGLNSLVAGDENEARMTYDRALSLAARNPSPSMRGDLAVAAIDLHVVIQLGGLTDGPATSELIRRISDAFEARPVPEGISSPGRAEV